ncbi:uncharacterized protein [Argopecten irradians]|uniref:uncharacterized protein isoform X2 n=1 Tax=Argopecten irradians TaxID=31199 RepID=UPI0037213051
MEKRKAMDHDNIQAKKGKWSCDDCNKSFEHKKTLTRHMVEHGDKKWKCNVCDKDFGRKDRLTRHKKIHGEPLHTCCGKSFWRNDKYRKHLESHMSNQIGGQDNKENNTPLVPEAAVKQADDSQQNDACSEEALGGTFKVVAIPAESQAKLDTTTFIQQQYDPIKKIIEQAVVGGGVKWYLSIQVQLSKPKGETVERVTPHFRGKCQITLNPLDIDEGMKESIRKMQSSFIEYQRQGSNWTLDKVIQIQIHFARYKPLKGSSYIPLPIKLRSKHAIINVQNKDKKCFMWSVLAALHPAKRNSQRVSKYSIHQNELDFTGITFPVKVADISKFETLNKISISVLGYEKGSLFPIHVTKQRFERHVDLLLISDGRKSHFCWIKDLNRLLNNQKSDSHRHFFLYLLFARIYKTKNFRRSHILLSRAWHSKNKTTNRRGQVAVL